MIDELTRPNYAKLRLRLDSSIADDVHRAFVGYYFPDTRSIAIFEMRMIIQTIKFLPLFPEASYRKPDGTNYLLDDFEVGASLVLGPLKNERDGGVVKPFIITDVDESHVTAVSIEEETIKGNAGRAHAARGDVDALYKKFHPRFPPAIIQRLGAVFTTNDKSGQRTATANQLFTACQDLAVDCSREEIQEIVDTLDENQDGKLSYEEFMYICRGKLSEARRQCIRKVFQKVDYNKNGFISTDELRTFYNPAYDPQLQTGQKTAEQLFQDFMNQFDVNRNGLISYQEFEDYYNGVSASYKSDQDFVNMMQRFWNLDHRNATGISFH